MHNDTIAAIATAPGRGAIGIVRLSGPQGRQIATDLFRSSNPSFSGLKPYRLHHGTLTDAEGKSIDDILCAYMPGPNSFTGEDTVELHCHGGGAVLQSALQALLAKGARLAGPGEFSRRAFLNGKMDLAQAEAIAEMINAPTRTGAGMAHNKLSGALSKRIDGLRSRLEELRAQLCLAVDFPEDDIECLPLDDFAGKVTLATAEIMSLMAAYERGRYWREGARVVLAGQVNAGKSSLLNALIGRERAIVTDCPGTTRDYLEESATLEGLSVRLVDTAGLREAEDAIEREGIRRSRDMVSGADLVLLVIDASEPMSVEDERMIRSSLHDRILVVLNKVDKPGRVITKAFIHDDLDARCVEVSATTGEGLENLSAKLRDILTGGFDEPSAEAVVPNQRQNESLMAAHAELGALLSDIRHGMPYDLLGVRLEAACVILSEITGRITSEDVLNSIFSDFCIGK